jgi:hypothetical protein
MQSKKRLNAISLSEAPVFFDINEVTPIEKDGKLSDAYYELNGSGPGAQFEPARLSNQNDRQQLQTGTQQNAVPPVTIYATTEC